MLEIKNLTIAFEEKKAVDGLSLNLHKNEIVGLVGESGCGKSLTAFSILGIIPPGSNISGEIIYKEHNILSLSEKEKQAIRGNKISLIPQDPMSALNPVFTIGNQISEIIQVHQKVSQNEAIKKTIVGLESVNIPNPSDKLNDYPYQFSGGMRQRVLIAMALANEPDILIADEPTTALDVTIQLQILELMKELKKRNKTILLITHDLAVVSEVCDRVYVMYLGKIVESAPVQEIFNNPKHPYTQGLLNSLPVENKKEIAPIKGQLPNLGSIPSGCTFHPRCDYAMGKCKKELPELYTVAGAAEHKSRCFLEIFN